MSGTSNKVMTNRKTAGTVYIQYGLKLFHSKSVVVVRGTQREYSSKPLKHSIVKRVLVFKQWIWAYFYPLQIFHLFGFPS